MTLFNHSIKSISDVKAEFPYIENIEGLLKNKTVKRIVDSIYKETHADEQFYTGKKVTDCRATQLREIAEARGLYTFLKAVESTAWLAAKYGIDNKRAVQLTERLYRSGINITNEAEIGEYIETRLFKSKTIRGRSFISCDF